MPLYPGVVGATVPVASNASPIVLQRGEYAYVFGVLAASATQLPIVDTNVAVEKVAGQAAAQVINSIAANLQAPEPGQPQPLVTVEISFAAAPGAGEPLRHRLPGSATAGLLWLYLCSMN